MGMIQDLKLLQHKNDIDNLVFKELHIVGLYSTIHVRQVLILHHKLQQVEKKKKKKLFPRENPPF